MKENFAAPDNKREEWALKALDLKERLFKVSQGEGVSIQEKIVVSEKKGELRAKLFKKYGQDEMRKCLLYHILAGSDGYEDIVEYFDFPEEYSVEIFIEELEKGRTDNKNEEPED